MPIKQTAPYRTPQQNEPPEKQAFSGGFYFQFVCREGMNPKNNLRQSPASSSAILRPLSVGGLQSGHFGIPDMGRDVQQIPRFSSTAEKRPRLPCRRRFFTLFCEWLAAAQGRYCAPPRCPPRCARGGVSRPPRQSTGQGHSCRPGCAPRPRGRTV